VRDGPLLVQGKGFFFAHRVAEAEPGFLLGEGVGLVEVGGVAESGKTRTYLREWQRQHAFDLGGIDGDAGCTETLAEELFAEQPAEGVPHDDRRSVEVGDVLNHIATSGGHGHGGPQPRTLRTRTGRFVDAARHRPGFGLNRVGGGAMQIGRRTAEG
jgi:hypothetical protein